MKEKHSIESIDDLKPSPYNDKIRKMSRQRRAALAKSIATFGDISGITWNKRTGRLVTGHQRVKELREKGGKLLEDPTRIETDTGEVFNVRVVDWAEPKEAAANYAANLKTAQGEFTQDADVMLSLVEDELPDVYAEMGMGELRVKQDEEVIGRVKFSEEIGEANNYVVLFFTNEIDWLSAQTHFELDSSWSKRRTGKPWSKGVGRVVNGGDYLRRMTDE